MIFEFTISLLLGITFIWLCIKLWDKWQVKRLLKKYPEGSLPKPIEVSRLDQVPVRDSKEVPSVDILNKLKN